MYARVARWEGADAETLDRTAAEIRGRADSGPPEGVPAKEFLLLNDGASGRSMAITLFETEEDLRAGDAVLNDMSPPDDGLGSRTSVENYEVAVDVRL